MTEDDGSKFDSIAAGLGDPTEEATRAEAEIHMRERMKATLERLDQEQLGRAIVTLTEQKPQPPNPDQSDAARLASAIERSRIQEFDEHLVGYILPVTPDNSEHLMIIQDGGIIVTTASYEPSRNIYKKYFEPSDAKMDTIRNKSTDTIINFIKDAKSARVVLSSDDPENLPALYEKLDQAVETARSLKDKKDRARIESATHVIDILDVRLFGKDKPPSSGGSPTQPPPPPQE